MKNFIHPGKTLSVLAPVAIASGDGVLVGNIFGVAAGAAAIGQPVEITTEGVFDLAKVSAQAWTVGALIYWDNTAKRATTAANGNRLIGVAASASDNPSDWGAVRLSGAPLIPVAGYPERVQMEAVAGAANVTEVTVSVTDAAGNAVAGVHHFDLYLCDDPDGEGLTATAASGTVTAKAASGTVLSALVAKKALRVQTLKNGVFVLEITDTGKTAFKVCAVLAGRTSEVGLTLTAADYGV